MREQLRQSTIVWGWMTFLCFIFFAFFDGPDGRMNPFFAVAFGGFMSAFFVVPYTIFALFYRFITRKEES